MSAEINNRQHPEMEIGQEDKERRTKVLKDIIEQLHSGKTVEEVRGLFDEHFSGVSAREITEAEQALIMSGTKVEEIQSLCDVHASVFKGSIEEIHYTNDPTKIIGHPANTLFLENRALEKTMVQIEENVQKNDLSALLLDYEKLQQLNIHYLKKENLLFPYMEKYGITAPPKVMWGVDDEIRAQLKTTLMDINDTKTLDSALSLAIGESLHRVREMIFKEENIMIPMLTENLTQDEWLMIAEGTKEFGYCLIQPPSKWEPAKEYQEESAAETLAEETEERIHGVITLPTGKFTIEELTSVLNMLPIDITFVDKYDRVKYFSEANERIFPRSRTVIGRNVSNCHPPASVHIVEGIVDDFKSGKKDCEDFWIKMGPKYILIRYFALRDDQGDYLGTLEVTQNIGPIQEITGEKRLVSLE